MGSATGSGSNLRHHRRQGKRTCIACKTGLKPERKSGDISERYVPISRRQGIHVAIRGRVYPLLCPALRGWRCLKALTRVPFYHENLRSKFHVHVRSTGQTDHLCGLISFASCPAFEDRRCRKASTGSCSLLRPPAAIVLGSSLHRPVAFNEQNRQRVAIKFAGYTR